MGHTTKERKEMLLSVLVQQYEEYLATVKPVSLTTLRNYRCRVRRYLETLPQNAALGELTRQSLIRYVHRVASSSPYAVRMHYAAIRHFCRWLISEGWLRASPADDIPLPKITRRRRETVPDDAVERLLIACDRLPGAPYRRTLARAALSLLIFGGLRRSEMLKLRIEDVYPERGEIFIRKGKGGDSRSVYVCKECLDALRNLLRERPECDHDFLLAQNRRYGLMFHGLRNILRDLHIVAGIEEHYTPHQLRHAYATRLERNGAPLSAIQAALGHKSIQTTVIYLHSSSEQVKQIAHLASLHPATTANERQTAPPPVSVKQEEAKRFRVRRLR